MRCTATRSPIRSTLSLVLALLLAAPAAAQVKNPGVFTYALSSEIDSLDPHWQFDLLSSEVVHHVYETLIGFRGSSTDDFEPLLAAQVPSVENGLLSRDGLRYAFPIRKDAKFHDGRALTPEDVKYSLMRFMLLDRPSGPSQLLLEPLLGVETTRGPDGKPDPLLWVRADERIRVEGGAVVLKLEEPYAPLLSILASFGHVVSRTWAVEHGDWDGTAETWPKFHAPPKGGALHEHANGTGPFRLERWDKTTKQVVLERNPAYWRSPAKLQRLIFRSVPDVTTRRLLLQAGDADAIAADRQLMPVLQEMEGVTIVDDLPSMEVRAAFLMNFAIEPSANPLLGSGRLDGDGIPPDFFNDLDVRKGFAYAFDYEAFVRDGFRGKGEQARGPIPRGVFGYNGRQPTFQRDPERAADHFRKARGGKVWDNGFRLMLVHAEGRQDALLACQIMKREVEALNPKFKVDIRAMQWPAWLAASTARKIPMTPARWSLDYPDAHSAVHPFLHSKGSYASVQGYKNERADRFIAHAKRYADRDKRRQLYFELQSLAYADVPTLFTADALHFQALRSWVKGWTYNPMLPFGSLYPAAKE